MFLMICFFSTEDGCSRHGILKIPLGVVAVRSVFCAIDGLGLLFSYRAGFKFNTSESLSLDSPHVSLNEYKAWWELE